MNINQLLDLGAIHRPLNVVINCRPDRVERNGQMGEIIPDLDPEQVFVIGHPAKSAIDAIPAEYRGRAVDLGGDRRDPEEFMAELLGRLVPAALASLVAIGNIHGQGEHLLEHLAELPADDSDEDAPAAPPTPEADERHVEHVDTMQLYAPRLDPYQRYPEAYESRYAPQAHVPHQRGSERPYPRQTHDQGIPGSPGPRSIPTPESPQPRGLFEPRVPPAPPADDSQQGQNPWQSSTVASPPSSPPQIAAIGHRDQGCSSPWSCYLTTNLSPGGDDHPGLAGADPRRGSAAGHAMSGRR
ncbi:hypothetical protein SANTM175S_10693 [Streptomyces antimycoticus]